MIPKPTHHSPELHTAHDEVIKSDLAVPVPVSQHQRIGDVVVEIYLQSLFLLKDTFTVSMIPKLTNFFDDFFFKDFF